MKFKSVKSFLKRKVFIIAEIGINHDGSESKCKKLIKIAKWAKADAAKIQIVNPIDSYERGTKSFREFSKRQLSYKQLLRLKKFAKKENIILFATPGDLKSLKTIVRLNFSIIKISSGLMTNLPLLTECFRTRLPVIISNGLGNIKDHEDLRNLIKKFKYEKKVAILKCTSQYPANIENIDLLCIKTLENYFKTFVGYSDHALGFDASLAAVAAGARIIEKHLTINKKTQGVDHRISLEPNQFKEMVKKIRKIEIMMGSKRIYLRKEISKNRNNFRRFLVLKNKVEKGDNLKIKDLSFLRLKNYKSAISSNFLYYHKNKKFKKSLAKGTVLQRKFLT